MVYISRYLSPSIESSLDARCRAGRIEGSQLACKEAGRTSSSALGLMAAMEAKEARVEGRTSFLEAASCSGSGMATPETRQKALSNARIQMNAPSLGVDTAFLDTQMACTYNHAWSRDMCWPK